MEGTAIVPGAAEADAAPADLGQEARCASEDCSSRTGSPFMGARTATSKPEDIDPTRAQRPSTAPVWALVVDRPEPAPVQ
jgi:hypothetical protein